MVVAKIPWCSAFSVLAGLGLVLACDGENALLGSNGSAGDATTGGAANPTGGSGAVSSAGAGSGGTGAAAVAGSGGQGAVIPNGTYTLLTEYLNLPNQDPTLCVPRNLGPHVDEDCAIDLLSPEECDCTLPGLAPTPAGRLPAIHAKNRLSGFCDAPGTPDCDSICTCEFEYAQGADLETCLHDASSDASWTGFCYVDEELGIGNPEIVMGCPESARRIIRSKSTPMGDTHAIISCVLKTPTTEPASPGPLGSVCLSQDEYNPAFSGHDAGEVTVDTGSPACESGVCLVNHFRGRASCPYGQSPEAESPECFVPYGTVPVSVPVQPQAPERSADQASICSCRCAGPGPGPFCSCPSGMECVHLIDELGLSDDSLAGSYCIPEGTAYDPTAPLTSCFDEGECGDPRPYPPVP